MIDEKKLEDECTEFAVQFFKDIPEDAATEPEHLTNARLPELAEQLAVKARVAGIQLELSTPDLKDIWTDASPARGEAATYEIQVTFSTVPMFSIPVLPRGAA